MDVAKIKAQVMFQTNNDKDDVGDFEPFLLGYINEGYDQILSDALGVHTGDTSYPPLDDDTDEPVAGVPEWVHGAIADYATYRVYMNGSSQKQNRAYPYLASYNRTKNRFVVGLTHTITNIPS